MENGQLGYLRDSLLITESIDVSGSQTAPRTDPCYGLRLEALRAVHGMGGESHRKVQWKDDVEGDSLEIDTRHSRLTDTEVEHVITLNPQEPLLLGSTQLTEDGLNRLRQALSNRKIEWEPPTQDERQSPAAPDQHY